MLEYNTHVTITQTSIDFVAAHRDADVRRLALSTKRIDDLDLPWALDQIAGRQRAATKLPGWTAHDGLIYPPHLALEQCSSQWTAEYKAGIARRLIMHGDGAADGLLVDLTGGLGVDCSEMAKEFDRAVYVERQERLCDIARHNFDLLGLDGIAVVHAEAEAYLAAMGRATMIYLDPSRRDSRGARTYAIADCTPNLLTMVPDILGKAPYCLVKLSPMLDWRKAVADCGGHVGEVHIVSTGNVCRELLLVLERGHDTGMSIRVVCVNDDEWCDFTISGDTFDEQPADEQPADEALAGVEPASVGSVGSTPVAEEAVGARSARETEDIQGVAYRELASYRFLYEPNASVMKAGYFIHVARRVAMRQLAPDSHLLVSTRLCEEFPGRSFEITGTTTLSKHEVKSVLGDLRQANVAVRNFPLSVAALRRRLKLRDGGETYLFATTTADGMHIVIRGVKAVATASDHTRGVSEDMPPEER